MAEKDERRELYYKSCHDINNVNDKCKQKIYMIKINKIE